MFRFIKWTVGASAIGAFLLFITFGTSAPSYLGAALGKAQRSVKEAIPIDFEIQRSARLIRQIAPQINDCLRDVAVGEVELADLGESIQLLKKREGKLFSRLIRRKNMLESGEPVYYIAGLKMERRRLELDLERVFEDLQNVQSLTRGKEKLLYNQEKSLVAARRKLEAVLAERSHLKDMLKSLKTQKRQVDALAAQSRKFELDDSSLVQARTALREVKKRLDVAQRMLEADLLDLAGFEEAQEQGSQPARNIVAEVNGFLAGKPVKRNDEVKSKVIVLPLRRDSM